MQTSEMVFFLVLLIPLRCVRRIAKRITRRNDTDAQIVCVCVCLCGNIYRTRVNLHNDRKS